MKKLFSVLVPLLVLSACARPAPDPGFNDSLKKCRDNVAIQEWETATTYALDALKMANSDEQKSLALSYLASLDLMTWRDAQAWEHAVEAEKLARKCGVDSLISEALLQKGRMCAYSAITETENRDDEALTYFREALEKARAAHTTRREVEILYNISQVYVSKNRFNNPIDPTLYKLAGDFLNQGVALAETEGYSDLVAKSLQFKMRYFRQAGRTDEGIACCKEILATLTEKDYLMRSQVNNQLVMLYALDGNADESAAAHQQYVYDIEHYMQQKADGRLQEMEARFELSSHESRIRLFRTLIILLLVLALVLTGAVGQSVWYSRKMKQQNSQLAQANHAKEQLLHLVSRDFTSPSFNKEISTTLRGLTSLSGAQIRERCQAMLKDEPDLADEVADYISTLVGERQKAASAYSLTAREMEIVRFSRDGLSAAEIADKMFISVHTVNNHKQNIYAKMGVRSNSEMVAKALSEGLL